MTTATTTPARMATLVLGTFIAQLRSGSPGDSWTNARNCSVLRLGSVRLSGIPATLTARPGPGRSIGMSWRAGARRCPPWSAIDEGAGEAHAGPVDQP